jgi:hypothetical protein
LINKPQLNDSITNNDYDKGPSIPSRVLGRHYRILPQAASNSEDQRIKKERKKYYGHLGFVVASIQVFFILQVSSQKFFEKLHIKCRPNYKPMFNEEIIGIGRWDWS